jgi:RNA polymerase sigma factor (TIGR02999 family)
MSTKEVRRLLSGIREGNPEDRDRLFSIVYEDLRRIAHNHLHGRVTGTLGTTAMVNEAYLRLAGPGASPWQDRAHFFAVASRVMRHVLVDHARAKVAAKRGGRAVPVELESRHAVELPRFQEILELDQALDRLGRLNERLARVVELRFFGDLSEEETAEALGVTKRTVRRDWRKARSFLHRQLHAPDDIVPDSPSGS